MSDLCPKELVHAKKLEFVGEVEESLEIIEK
jgi:hypothetical protein